MRGHPHLVLSYICGFLVCRLDMVHVLNVVDAEGSVADRQHHN